MQGMETELQRLGDNFAGLGKYFVHQDASEVFLFKPKNESKWTNSNSRFLSSCKRRKLVNNKRF